MLYNISTRFEINLQDTLASEIGSASTFILKNKIPTMIVNTDLFMSVLADRQMKTWQMQPPYKIIVAIDFRDNGKHYAMDKVKLLPREVLEADGYDIMITPGRNEIETGKEMNTLHDFFKQMNPMTEIRWVLGCRTQTTENILTVIKMAKKYPPNFIRTDSNVVIPQQDIGNHRVDIKLIKDNIGIPIKLSGNINWEIVKEMKDQVARFDVSISQARSILINADKDINQAKTQEAQKLISDSPS